LIAGNLMEELFHSGGYNHWTGLLDWTTGLTQTAKYTPFSAEHAEAKYTYSLSYFANTAPYSVFPGASRGRRSCAYLISLNCELPP